MNPRDGQNIEWGIHYLSFGIPAMLVQMAAVVIFILINAKAIENGTPYEVGDRTNAGQRARSADLDLRAAVVRWR